ncbi:MAG: hypothetical protein MR011_05870 [Lachnospiraceae bacterium]|nr:hypothetical protein [Lachnospiraceae bacterium]
MIRLNLIHHYLNIIEDLFTEKYSHSRLKIEVSSDIRGTAEIDLKHGIMRINPNSDNLVGSVLHELVHLIKSETPDKYNILSDLTIEALKESKNVSYNELFNEYADRYREVNPNYSDEDIIEEIVADRAYQMIRNFFVFDVAGGLKVDTRRLMT